MPTSLSERIKLINKQNEYRMGKVSEEAEAKCEESLVNTVEAVWETTKENELSAQNPVTIEQVYAKMEEIYGVVLKMADDMAKVNKHINATQKMLKKAEKPAKEKKK